MSATSGREGTSAGTAERRDASPGEGAPKRGRAWLRLVAGTISLAAVLGYAALMYSGVGPFLGSEVWWQPRSFMLDTWLTDLFEERIKLGIAAMTAPAVLLTILIFPATRSSLVRTLGLAGALAAALFLFYGLRDPGPMIWTFFGWRGSAVILWISLVVAAAAFAPLLAGSWLRRGWPSRLILYLPIFAALVIVERSATGTNPALPFNISPWPVITVFGTELIDTLIVGILACAALATASFGLRRRSPAACALGIAVGVAVPIAWVSFRLPGGVTLLGTALAISAVAVAVASRVAGTVEAGLRSGAGQTACGAILVALPLFVGQGWVQLDYRETRDVRAETIIDALGAFYERKDLYPEDLDELVASKDLAAVPRPRIGFPFIVDEDFTYQNFGTDYLLEFSAPGWVMCGYNPPWQDDPDAEEEEDEEPAEEGGEPWLPGAWSCPSKPPALW